MASVVTSILSSTVGLLLNKVRNKTADKLKDRDITDAKIREIIVRDLDDVKTKIDGLSRKDLLTSYNFLQEGVNLVKASLDKSEANQKAVFSSTRNNGGETSAKPSEVKSGILSEALTLSQAIGKVKINSNKEFETSKERFKDARKKATEALCNEGLSTKDKIFAAKLRIVSELLECLECPETAITNCLPFLETFYSLPAIREIFSVYINGGVRSLVNKAERVESVKSVMLISYVLFQFVLEFSCKCCVAITWPTIELGDRNFHPILHWREVSTRKSWGKEFSQPPNEVIPEKKINRVQSAVNSRGEIISRAFGTSITVTSRTGEVKTIKLNFPGDGEDIKRCVIGVAVDNNNNIYALTFPKTRTESGGMKNNVLFVFDKNYNVKQRYTLHFFEATAHCDVHIVINQNNNVVISMHDDPHVYVCDKMGKLKHKFKLDTSYLRRLTISDKNEILLASDDRKAVHRYTEKGDLVSTIKVPEGHVIRGVVFHLLICKILVLTFMKKSDSYFLLCYCETGEQANSSFLGNGSKLEYPEIRSHPSGPVVVVWKNSITYI